MILVDTSVLINYLKGRDTEKTGLFAEVLVRDIPFGISPYTYQEVLQGARDESEFDKIKTYLSSQTFYALSEGFETYERAARMYFDLRRKGVTVRSTIDVLIARTAIECKLALLHDDRDFDHMAAHIRELRILCNL